MCHAVGAAHYVLFKKASIFFRGFFWCYSAAENSSFPTPQSGQTKSSGTFSQDVPAAIPASSTPTVGSYSQPHTSHIYFFISQKIKVNKFVLVFFPTNSMPNPLIFHLSISYQIIGDSNTFYTTLKTLDLCPTGAACRPIILKIAIFFTIFLHMCIFYCNFAR